ncbi:MAG: NADH-quinone oxidoreductase subunit A [Chloroflexi bacterium]|nr:NADH-quinone oxidoreductase subunit A [Chloroflexota bacterium]
MEIDKYATVGVLLLLSLIVPASLLVLSYLFSFVRIRPRPDDSSAPYKRKTYECGMETVGPSWVQFNIRYYYFALLFVVFDVETVFLYPWAVRFQLLGLFGFVEMLLFLAVLVLGLLYAWKKEVLTWR